MKPNTVRRTAAEQSAKAAHSEELQRNQGLMAGSVVLTLEGEMPVEFLSPGDRVITRDSGMAVVRAVHRRLAHIETVHIKAGSLGHARPESDVTLPASQEVLIRDWRAEALFGSKQALVPARRLADGEFVTLQAARDVTLHIVEFDREHVIYADGLEVSCPLLQERGVKVEAA